MTWLSILWSPLLSLTGSHSLLSFTPFALCLPLSAPPSFYSLPFLSHLPHSLFLCLFFSSFFFSPPLQSSTSQFIIHFSIQSQNTHFKSPPNFTLPHRKTRKKLTKTSVFAMSAAVAAAAAAAAISRRNSSSSSTTTTRSSSDNFYGQYYQSLSMPARSAPSPLISRYETQKRRDWNNFRQYLRNRCPTLSLAGCSGTNVVEFLSYLDEFGQTKVHAATCSNFGHRYPPDSFCDCPTRQPWTSLSALIGRLRVAFEENGGNPVTNPFNAVDVKIYINDLKNSQEKSRGIIDGYE